MASKPIWTGSIRFGLVAFPIRLHTAVRPKDVRFHLLHERDHARIRTRYITSTEEEEVAREDLVRGYEVAPDEYVVVREEELEALAPESRHVIDIREFVDLSEIDPIHFDRSYYLAPAEDAGTPYALLLETLRRSDKAGIGSFVFRTREHVVAVRPRAEILCLETLHYADEIEDPRAILGDAPAEPVGERELRLAHSIVEALSAPWQPEQYRDTYREALLDLIERKAEGRDVAAQAVTLPPTNVVDLMEALEASLEEARRRRRSA